MPPETSSVAPMPPNAPSLEDAAGLQEMVLERAQADVVLSVASAAASRAAQALTTLLGMQV